VDGLPHSGNPDTECFNPVVNSLGLPEILGANIHEKIYRWPWMNKERAYVQLISKLLGVEFDAIWQRHKRLLIQKIITWAAGIIAVLVALFGVWNTSKSVDVEMTLNEVSVHNENLPPLKDAVVTLMLDNETKTDTIHSLDVSTIFANIPHRFIGEEVRVQVACQEAYLPIDTTFLLNKMLVLNIHRNPDYYGNLRFRLWNPSTEKSAPHTEVSVDGHHVKSDADGIVTYTVPLEEQKQCYFVTSSQISILDSIVFAPCGSDDCITFK
jgi:hypothetical protein